MTTIPVSKRQYVTLLDDNGDVYTAAGGGAVAADVNLTEVAGAAVAQGHGTAAAALRVELPTDGTGVIAGITNNVNTVEVGDSYAHITTATTTVVKASAGTVKKVSVNSLGTVASTVSVQDDATVLAVIDSLILSGTWDYNIACATNITIVTTGTVAPDVTVSYR